MKTKAVTKNMIEKLSQHGTELRPFEAWLKSIGRSPATGWRWRQLGWVRVLRIGGRNYLAAEELGRFLERAKSGEFSSDTRPPMKKEAAG